MPTYEGVTYHVRRVRLRAQRAASGQVYYYIGIPLDIVKVLGWNKPRRMDLDLIACHGHVSLAASESDPRSAMKTRWRRS